MYYLRSSEKTTYGPLSDHFWITFGPLLDHFWTIFGLLLDHFLTTFTSVFKSYTRLWPEHVLNQTPHHSNSLSKFRKICPSFISFSYLLNFYYQPEIFLCLGVQKLDFCTRLSAILSLRGYDLPSAMRSA